MSPLLRQPLTVEHALLGFLRERPMHGYEIYQRLAGLAGLGLVWQVKQSHLYAMLDKLEGDGYIAGRQQAQAARPPRRIFRLTGAGRKAFRGWLKRPVAHGREIRLEFMAKLFFARREGPEWVDGLIARQKEECADWRANIWLMLEAGRLRPGFLCVAGVPASGCARWIRCWTGWTYVPRLDQTWRQGRAGCTLNTGQPEHGAEHKAALEVVGYNDSSGRLNVRQQPVDWVWYLGCGGGAAEPAAIPFLLHPGRRLAAAHVWNEHAGQPGAAGCPAGPVA